MIRIESATLWIEGINHHLVSSLWFDCRNWYSNWGISLCNNFSCPYAHIEWHCLRYCGQTCDNSDCTCLSHNASHPNEDNCEYTTFSYPYSTSSFLPPAPQVSPSASFSLSALSSLQAPSTIFLMLSNHYSNLCYISNFIVTPFLNTSLITINQSFLVLFQVFLFAFNFQSFEPVDYFKRNQFSQ